MKYFALLLGVALSLHATDYHVASYGSDSNNGLTKATPFLTVDKFNQVMACGDRLLVASIVDGSSYAVANTVAKFIPNCSINPQVISEHWDMINRPGYRTRPVAADGSALDRPYYGQIKMNYGGGGQGIVFTTEGHGSYVQGDSYLLCSVNVTGGTTFTFACNSAGGGLLNGANDLQVELELDWNATFGNLPPTGVNMQTKYWTVNCMSCDMSGGTTQLSLTKGGSPITGITCTSPCAWSGAGGVVPSEPLQVDLATSTFTIVDGTPSGAWVNGLPVSLSSASGLVFGTIPAPLTLDSQYYLCHVIGQTFKLCSDPGGTSTITLTDNGVGPLIISSNHVPQAWQFLGIEYTTVTGTAAVSAFVSLSTGASAKMGAPHGFLLDHSDFHQPETTSDGFGASRIIFSDSALERYIDSQISGANVGESKAVNGCSSIGPTLIQNSLLWSGGEDVLWGGCFGASGTINQNKKFFHNLYTRPAMTKVTTNNTGVAQTLTGHCLYTDYDPDGWSGGEWFVDNASGITSQCGPDRLWHVAVGALSCVTHVCGDPQGKNLAEHKGGMNMLFLANVMDPVWVSAQQGEPFNLSGEPGFTGGGPYGNNTHIALRYNASYNIWASYTRQNLCNLSIYIPCPDPPGDFSTSDNLWVVNTNACGVTTMASDLFRCGAGPITQPTFLNAGMVDSLGNAAGYNDFHTHETVYMPDTGLGSSPYLTWVFNSTPGCVPPGGIYNTVMTFLILYGNAGADCQGTSNTNTIGSFYRQSTFSSIVMKGSAGGFTNTSPNTFTNNVFPANNTLLSYNGADGITSNPLLYGLTSASPYSASNMSGCTLCTDGRDVGADIVAVANATSGVYEGIPTWSDRAHLTFLPGSTKMVVRYNAPSMSVCTVYVYNSPGRTPASLVTSVADSNAAAVTSAKDRQIAVSGLAASTQYWPELICDAQTMVPDPISIWTRASGSGDYPTTFTFDSATVMQYGSSLSGGAIVSPTVLGAATTQIIPCATNSFCYAQIRTNGPISIVASP